jgi:putative membrane protein
VLQQVGEDEGEDAVRFFPHSVTVGVLIVVALLLTAWLLSILGSIVAFGAFTLTRTEDRIRIRRGLISRNEANVPVGRVRAVRVVEGLLRRPFGLCALTIEVTGYADEASAARTLFPLVRTRDVRAFLAEFLPEMADDVEALQRPPARAARRYLLAPTLLGIVLAAGAWWLVGTWAAFALVVGAYGWAQYRAAGWRIRDGRLAIRTLRIARVTVLAPARLRESHTVSQNVFQRRASLADLSVAFGKSTTARIRHIEAADAATALTRS